MANVPHYRPIFGRRRHCEELGERASVRGVTFVMGPPRVGKTWLVRHLVYSWADPKEWLVVYRESSSGKNDLLREVVAELYKRWLNGASFRQQAGSLLQRHKSSLIGKVGGAVASMLGEVLKATSGVDGVTAIVDKTIDRLGELDRDLREGGQTLKPITYDDARDLVCLIARLTEKRILLVIDAWERGQTLLGDRGSIQKMLDNSREWPDQFHLVVVIRDLPKHLPEVEFADECCRDHPHAKRYALEPLDLSDPCEQDDLLNYLAENAPAVRDDDRDWVLAQCATTPDVITWWCDRQPNTVTELRDLADQVRTNRYSGLTDLIAQAGQDDLPLFDATVRLALLPEITSQDMWRTYAPLIDPDTADGVMGELQNRRILDAVQISYPVFGHVTAYDAVRSFLLAPPTGTTTRTPRPRVAHLLKELITDLSGRITRNHVSYFPWTQALAVLSDPVERCGLPTVWTWPPRLAATLVGTPLSGTECERLIADAPLLSREVPPAKLLLGAVLLNTLVVTKTEKDLACGDAVLDKLRELARCSPVDVAVQMCLAHGLVVTLVSAKLAHDTAQCNAMLDELHELAKRHPGVRAQWAETLFASLQELNPADVEHLARCDALLNRLRELARWSPENVVVRMCLVHGLVITLISAAFESDTTRYNAMLDELRELAKRHPGVREEWAARLVALLRQLDPEHVKHLERHDVLLDELRELARRSPDDVRVRKFLVQELDVTYISALLDELHELAKSHPGDHTLTHILTYKKR